LFTALAGIIGFIIYVIVMVAVYISPLTIKSPCIVAQSNLPSKPHLLAHKGASAVRGNFVIVCLMIEKKLVVCTQFAWKVHVT